MASAPFIVSKRPRTDEYWFREGCHITELSNTAEDPDVSVARARVEPGCVTRWHALEETVERYLILQGHGEVGLGDEPPRPVAVHDVVTIPAGCPQRIRNTGEQDLVFLAICSPRFLPSNYRDLEPDPEISSP